MTPNAPPPPPVIESPPAATPIAYANPDLADWRRPWAIPILAYACVGLATLAVLVSWRGFPAVLEMHALTAPPPAPVAPRLAAPTVAPMPGDFTGDAGVHAADRRRVLDAVDAKVGLSPDRRFMLDLLLAEIGADLAGPEPLTAARVGALSASRRADGPDLKGLLGPQPTLGTLVVAGPGGTAEVNDAGARFTRADGRGATLRGGFVNGYDGARRWAAPLVEADLRRQFGKAGRRSPACRRRNSSPSPAAGSATRPRAS